MSSAAEVNMSKEELITTVMSLKRALSDADGKLGQQDEAIEALTSSYRELRRKADQAHEYKPAGTDAEALDRYTMPADVVGSQVTAVDGDYREPVRYANPQENRAGLEYIGSKDASRAIRMFSEWDEVGNVSPGLLDDPEPCTAWQLRLQQLSEMRTLARIFLSRTDHRGQVRLGASPKIDSALRRHLVRGPDFVKQVFADNAGEGGEFIPDIVMPELGRRLELPRSVMALLPTVAIPTGGTTRNPFLIAGCQPFIYPMPTSGDLDPADIQRSVPSTTDTTHSPVTWGVTLPATRDATEDSIIEWGSFGNMMLAEAIRDGEEDAVINADTGGGDTGLSAWNIRSRWNTVGNDNDHRKSFIGLRAHSFDVSSAGAIGTESALGILAELIHMDSPQFMGDVIFVTSPEWVLLKLLQDTNLITVDKMGNLATLLTGQVGAVGGHPVVMSEFVDVQYNASGVYDDTTKTKTGILAFNRSRWAKAVRRGPRVEAEVVARQHTSYLTLTERWTLRHLGRSTEKSVTWQYNATAS